MNRENVGWVRGRLERTYARIPELLAAPNVVTPDFETWCANVKRALEGAYGDRHPFTREFVALTMVHRAAIGVPGRPDSWQAEESRTAPHEVLRRAEDLLQDALAALSEASPPAVPVQNPSAERTIPRQAQAKTDSQAVPKAFRIRGKARHTGSGSTTSRRDFVLKEWT